MSNVTKVIVVIGSVTQKQYSPVRLELLREGIKAKIVRIPANLFPQDPEGEILDQSAIARRHGVSDYELGFHDNEPDESVEVNAYDLLAEEIASDYELDFDLVEAVVVGADANWLLYSELELEPSEAELIFGPNLRLRSA